MKSKLDQICRPYFALLILPLVLLISGQVRAAVSLPQRSAADSESPAHHASPVRWSEIGTKAGSDCRGDGLVVRASAQGAGLRCVFQRIEGEATSEGLWLVSSNAPSERFGVVATSMGHSTQEWVSLSPTGRVEVTEKLAHFIRPGLVEEYSVSMEGVRQDFIVMERPVGTGWLRVQLAVRGARIESADYGACLVLSASARKIAYSRLRATDTTGRELSARMEVFEDGAERHPPGASVANATMLAVLVNDADAVYPVRIDPTFSDANWVSMNPNLPGADGPVDAAAVDDSGNLYIGGGFNVVGDVAAHGIAKWNGSGWSALGSGLGSGINNWVYALAVSGTNLYAGGYFTSAGGVPANYIAKWNGSSWSALGSGMSSGVSALAVSGGDLYAAGSFTTAGGIPANYIAKWNGISWSALGSGMNNQVYALAISGGDLYAGGYFTTAGGIQANAIAKWNGTSWSVLGSGMGGSYISVTALAVSGEDLYAGGTFTTAGGISANYIATWNGSIWSALGSGMNDYVYALAVSGGDLYAGGDFTTAGGILANCIAKWDGNSWSALDSGMNNHVSALAISGANLYAGGTFTTARGISVAAWNGSSWSALGSGMNGGVSALAVSGGDLYAGGQFTSAGGISANYIAKWNGSSWSALGSGMDSNVSVLAVSGGDLYAGGDFTTAGGIPAHSIAKWNGSSWSALGSGMGGTYLSVSALAVLGDDLYAGGTFTTAGGISANYIAKWNGNSWSALGSGMNSFGYVVALAISGGDLYAGGNFTTAGGIAAINIAKWNGSSWSALGSGMSGSVPALAGVSALAAFGTNLYAGGSFTTAGGIPANRIAKWNGSSWSALGSGINNWVNELVISGGELYAGGSFTFAGGKISAYMARAYLDLPILSTIRSGSNVILSWSASFGTFALQQNLEWANRNGWSNANYPMTTNGPTKSATIPVTSGNQFFRLQAN